MKSYNEKEIAKELEYGEEFTKVSTSKLKHGIILFYCLANSYRFIYGIESLPKRI